MEARPILGDERLAWMQGRHQPKYPTFLCPSQNQVAFLCPNPKCDAALHCSDVNCFLCSSKHRNCGKVYKIAYLADMLNNLIETREEVIRAVYQIDRQFDEQFERSFGQFSAEYPHYTLDEKTRRLVDKIYYQEKAINMSGVQADNLCTEIWERVNEQQSRVTEQLKQYEQKMGELSQQAKLLKKKLRESLTPKKWDFKGFDSVILKYPNDDEKIEFLVKSLADIKPIKSLQLLFRGSKDGFKASTFHEKCDNIDDTVVIVRTDGETNNTVAGYSHYRWNEVNNNYVNDAGKKTFLLQLNRREKFVPQNGNHLIYCSNSYGPIFGRGHDLCIWDDCNSNNNSSSFFPYTYNFEGPNKIWRNQQSITDFSGATKGTFRVIDYEVFKVVFR